MSRPAFFGRSDLARMLWAFRREFWLVALFSAAANLLMLTPTVYMLQVYDRVLVSYSELTLAAVSAIALFLLAIMAVSEWTRSRILARAGVQIDQRLGSHVFSSSAAAGIAAGAPPAGAFGDLLQLRQFLTSEGVFAFFDAPWVPIYLAVCFVLHPVLGEVALFFVVVQLVVVWTGQRRMAASARAAAGEGRDLAGFLTAKLHNAEVLEAMGMLPRLHARWRQRHARQLLAQGTQQRQAGRYAGLSKFIRHTQQSLALAAGAVLVIEGELSAGGMIAATLLMNRALAPVDLLVGGWRQFVAARESFARLEQLFERHPAPTAAAIPPRPAGALSLRGVTAGVPGREHPILRAVDLEVPAGTTLVVFGPSGAGKSTLARVLLGLWPGVGGDVLLDGRPLAAGPRDGLGHHLGYLPQGLQLFRGSIAENIGRFAEGAADGVVAAARAAGVHEMILRLPQGYDTVLSPDARSLPGGLRQRIALARALYGWPAVVVLDEPNSNLDEEGEAALMAALAKLKARGSTVVLVSHRPAAIAAADRLLLLRDGAVVAQGPRDQVLAGLRPISAASAAPAVPVPGPHAA